MTVMERRPVKAPWNIWEGTVYAAKGLDGTKRPNAPGCWGGLVFNPPKQPQLSK